MTAVEGALTRPWPLTGRHEDLDELCAAVEEGCPAFFILGEAGSGKTRLAREVLRRLEGEGWSVAGATATESARSTPLGAVAHLVPVAAIDSPPSVFHETQVAIAERTDGQVLVLHVDDAHHLDPSSASLLVSLAESGAVRLLLTMRPGLRAPDAISGLRGGHGVRSLVLGSLDPLAVDALLHRVLGAPLDGVAEAQLLHTSGGNPLYLRELVLGAVADGSLRNVSGVWRLSGPLPTTEALGDRVLGRIAGLPDAARDALELIAAGEPIGLNLLETLVDPLVLEHLEGNGLVRVEQHQRRSEVSLAHPVYGEILRAGIGRVRLRRLSRVLAETFAATGARRSGDAARMVRWQIDAGIVPDAEVILAGVRLARHDHDWASVARMSRAAIDAGVVDATALLAEAHFELGEQAEVDEVTTAALADPSGLSDAARSQLHRTRAMSLAWGHDDPDGALAELDVGLAAISDRSSRGTMLFAVAGVHAWQGRVAEAMELVEPLLVDDDPQVGVQAATIAELVSAVCGPTSRAIELADAWLAVHLALPDMSGTTNPGNHIVIKTVALTHAGRLREAAELAEYGYGASVATRNLIGQMWFALEQGRIAMLRGDALAARRWYSEQVALCRGTGHQRPIALGLSGLAVAEAHLGDASAAARAVADLGGESLAMLEIFATERVRGEAWAAAAAGDPAAARAALVAGAELAEERGITLLAGMARLDALRLGDPNQAAPLAAAAAVCESGVLDLAARWAAATNDPEELSRVAEGFEELGCVMFAAEAFAAAGTAWRRAGETRRAAADEQRADELARRCRGGATPALVVVESVVPLTAREREIAVLVADGLTTKDVAERLYLSARTVSNHLQNAYTKLGISKRTELAGALSRHGDAQGGRA